MEPLPHTLKSLDLFNGQIYDRSGDKKTAYLIQFADMLLCFEQ